MKCIVCGKQLKGNQTKYCSSKCMMHNYYERNKSRILYNAMKNHEKRKNEI